MALASRAALAVVVALAVPQARARADEPHPCAPATIAWARQCSGEGLHVIPRECPPGRALFSVALGEGPTLRIDVARAPGGLAHVGTLALQPVGEYRDWATAPATARESFTRFVRCASSGAGTLTLGAQDPQDAPELAPVVPLRLVGALACLLLVVATRRRRPRWRAFLPLLLAPATWAYQRVTFPVAYFHQNGQGPLWIRYALGRPSPYGPGYHELFGLVVHGTAAPPDLTLFDAQSLLAATSSVAAFVVARATGARRALAWSVATVVALDPELARLARGESYYATCGALLWLAAAVLAYAARPLRPRTPAFVLGVLAAGLFVAQAARVHPVCWTAAACVPIVIVVGRGRPRRRLIAAALAAAGIGLVVLATTGAALRETLVAGIGRDWVGRPVGPSWQLVALIVAALLAVTAAARTAGRTRQTLVRLAAFLVVVVVACAADRLDGVPAWISEAYVALYAAPLLAAGGAILATWLHDRRRAMRAVLVVAAIGAVLLLARVGPLRVLPTDAREQALAMRWRSQLPDGATVVYLARAGRRVLELPLETGREGPRLRTRAIAADSDSADVATSGDAVYYYRSSLCALLEGRDACVRLEAAIALTAVLERTLPAIASIGSWTGPSPVRVGLYRVRSAP